ncbi:MAG: Cys-tRNA(Pro) deacylase [Bacilli bacterium]|jgi:Cys-tRNA(Pro)/Cys-tRNA(Cys) deacylase|nr:Cys-tRNA(Pro) deacylase [Bacilli bacterium]
MHKTNAMRILDREKIEYKLYNYENSNAISGIDVADYLQVEYHKIFKTLVTQGKSKEYYVFIIPVDKTLDLKKAAHVVNEKSIQMIKSKDLKQITNYVHGGCSPIGMKNTFKTIINDSALKEETILVNGGKIGYNLELKLDDLNKIIDIQIADIIVL